MLPHPLDLHENAVQGGETLLSLLLQHCNGRGQEGMEPPGLDIGRHSAATRRIKTKFHSPFGVPLLLYSFLIFRSPWNLQGSQLVLGTPLRRVKHEIL